MDVLSLDNEPWNSLVSWPSGDEVAVMISNSQMYQDLGVGMDASFT
jgi:hypothetical protein